VSEHVLLVLTREDEANPIPDYKIFELTDLDGVTTWMQTHYEEVQQKSEMKVGGVEFQRRGHAQIAGFWHNYELLLVRPTIVTTGDVIRERMKYRGEEGVIAEIAASYVDHVAEAAMRGVLVSDSEVPIENVKHLGRMDERANRSDGKTGS
jgi:hypothetical protein